MRSWSGREAGQWLAVKLDKYERFKAMIRKSDCSFKPVQLWAIIFSFLAAVCLCQRSIAMETAPTQNSRDFAFDFARECAASDSDKKPNLVVSPYGAYCLLSLLSNGAAGGTPTEMMRMLHVGTNTTDALNVENKRSLEALKSTDEK